MEDRTATKADIRDLRVAAINRGVVSLAESSGHGGDEYLRQFLAANEYGLARDDLIDHLLSGGEGIPSEGHRDLLAKVDYLLAFDIDKMGAEAHAEVQEVVDEIDALIAGLDAPDTASITEGRS